jgi:hypothetical protein
LVEISLLIASCGISDGQKVDISASTQQELSLNRANDGQHISAKVGQPIVVTLQTIGGGQYDNPQISSRAIRFESAVFPAKQNPGGPTQVYRFTAVADGECQIRIPHTGSNPTVTFTIQVTKH